MKYADDLNNIIKFIDNLCVPKKDNCLDARINEMRWCTASSVLDGVHSVMVWMVYTPWLSGWLDDQLNQLKYPEVSKQYLISL